VMKPCAKEQRLSQKLILEKNYLKTVLSICRNSENERVSTESKS